MEKADDLPHTFQIVQKSMCDCREEVEILLRYGHHPGIVGLRTVFEDAGKVYMVLQLLRGGNLLEYMLKRVSDI